jgi:uncharacterized protein (DUF433 family)/DNA-binding transcriptional MerR regulator
MAYATHMAAALSGATVSQLRHWRSHNARTRPLLEPEVSPESRIIYSFRDLLALRTFVRLRQDASLQRIRRAVNSLRDLGEVEHLSRYQLVSDPSGNIRFITDEEDEIELARRPGQMLLVSMADVIEPFSVRPGVVVPALFKPRAHIAVDPDTQAGYPVIAGTRVPYDAVASLMREDVPAEKISDYYPTVSAEAARDALDFARYVDNYGPPPRAA